MTRPRVFCASLADVFEQRPELAPWRADLFRLIDRTPNLDWLLLTKRPENIASMWHSMTAVDEGGHEWGQCVPTARRFSAEPLIGPVDLPGRCPFSMATHATSPRRRATIRFSGRWNCASGNFLR